jgi:hypothetical protein
MQHFRLFSFRLRCRYSQFWYAIDTGVSNQQMNMLLGGETSMWTDNYCYIYECLGTGPVPVAAVMYNSTYDAQFAQSVSGIMWPRASVAAASYWNYIPTVDPNNQNFIDTWLGFNDVLISRGIAACPSGCYCDELSSCGVNYIN